MAVPAPAGGRGAHVQTGDGTRATGPGLDKITELVDQPETLAVQILIGPNPVPGQRVGNLAGVADLADDPVAGPPEMHRPAAGVAQGVTSQLVDGDGQVGDAQFSKPGTLGPAGDELRTGYIVAEGAAVPGNWRSLSPAWTKVRSAERYSPLPW